MSRATRPGSGPTQDELVDRLASLPQLRGIPRDELEWLVAHGHAEVADAGILIAPGEEIEYLYVILSGRIAVRVDRGVGPRRAMDWSDGDVTGALPYSRVGLARNDVLVEVRTELLSIHRDHFPEMIRRCPDFTALTVHTMVDRARHFRSGDLQDEKMMSLGRLAAGLAHELNNPASAALRGAKLLRSDLSEIERAARTLCRAGVSEEQITSIEQMCGDWLEPSVSEPDAGREAEIGDWLARRRLDVECAAALAESSVTIKQLDKLVDLVPEPALNATICWMSLGATARLTAMDIENAVSHIYDLVAAVKRFTQMDRVSGPEAVDIEAGLKDTIRMVAPRAGQKEASVTLRTEPKLPLVRAVVGDLNQVWMNLIENAIEAVGKSGRIEITVRKELDHVVVHVVDDGPGIGAELIDRVFDPFFTTKEPGQGLGLGLEIARQLVRRCEGEIAVSSEPGRTEFRVSLPAELPDVREETIAPRGEFTAS